jgi:pyrroline-5-carboxylate reductase
VTPIDLKNISIAFIGGGNMARSLIGGLLKRGATTSRIAVSDPFEAARTQLQSSFGVRTSASNIEVAHGSDVIVLAVKPQELPQVARELSASLHGERPLVISIAAGTLASDISRWLGDLPVVRAMPNRPALQGCGVSGLYASAEVTEHARALATEILGAVGPALWVSHESQMDVVTAVSGSGPAYFFLLTEMIENAGIQLGLPAQISRQLAVETAYGSGMMARAAEDSPATLREQVTSKGGTTAAALQVLESREVRAIFAAAIAAAARRSAELAEQSGDR